jgi:hypothetical protein
MKNSTKYGFSGITDLATNSSDLNKKLESLVFPIKTEKHAATPISERSADSSRNIASKTPPKQKNAPQIIFDFFETIIVTSVKAMGLLMFIIIMAMSIVFIYLAITDSLPAITDSLTSSRRSANNASVPSSHGNIPSNVANSNIPTLKPDVTGYYSYSESFDCSMEFIRMNVFTLFSDGYGYFITARTSEFANGCKTKTHVTENAHKALREMAPLRVATVADALATCKIMTSCRSDALYATDSIDFRFNSEEIMSMQNLLKDLGYEVGKSDGIFGPKTSNAIKQFQSDIGIRVTGKPSINLFLLLSAADSEFFEFDA